MRLEDKFFNSFFYLFLIAIFFSIIIVMTTLIYFSQDFLDEETATEVIDIEKRYAKANINSMNILLYNIILKLQVNIQQIITLYQNIAGDLLKSSDYLNFTDIDSYNAYEYKEKMKNANEVLIQKLAYTSIWFINNENVNISLVTNETKKQIYIISMMTPTMNSLIQSNNDLIQSIYFVFDKTDLFSAFPFIYQLSYGFLDIFDNYTNNPAWCTDENGDIITYYKFKCRTFYKDITNAQKTFSIII